MKTFSRIVAGLSLATLLAACDSNDVNINPSPQPPLETGQLRVIHAVADAPTVSVGNSASTVVSGLGFKEATAFLDFAVGTLNVQVDADVPGGSVTVIPPVDIAIAANTRYSVIAAGEAALGTIAPILIENPISAVGGGNVRVEVVHAAAKAPDVDIYVTAPGTPLAGETPIAGGATPFGATSGPITVPAGDYQIRVTLPGSLVPVFDSGTVSLPVGADLLVAAVDNTNPGNPPVPVSLLVADGQGSFEILHAETPADVRVVHAVPDAPPVDVYVNDPMAMGLPAISGLGYTQFEPDTGGYVEFQAGTANVLVTAAGDPGVIAIPATDIDLEAGKQYSIYAAGTFATIAPFITTDDSRSIATEARVRIIHLAPSAGLVDLYVNAPMTDIATVDPTFTDVDFQDETGYVSLAGGTYQVTVTLAGTKTAAIGPLDIIISDGNVYTAVARDPDPTVANDPFGLILLDDF